MYEIYYEPVIHGQPEMNRLRIGGHFQQIFVVLLGVGIKRVRVQVASL